MALTQIFASQKLLLWWKHYMALLQNSVWKNLVALIDDRKFLLDIDNVYYEFEHLKRKLNFLYSSFSNEVMIGPLGQLFGKNRHLGVDIVGEDNQAAIVKHIEDRKQEFEQLVKEIDHNIKEIKLGDRE